MRVPRSARGPTHPVHTVEDQFVPHGKDVYSWRGANCTCGFLKLLRVEESSTDANVFIEMTTPPCAAPCWLDPDENKELNP